MRDIVFIDGLSCGLGTSDPFIQEVSYELCDRYVVHRIDPSKMDRSSTETALNDITAYFQHLERKPIVIGYSLGGLWAMLLARRGFTDHVISLSPAAPTNYFQIDPLRLWIFGRTLLTGQPFRFTHEIAYKVLMPDAPRWQVHELAQHFRDEPASLIREYAWLGGYPKLSAADIRYLRRHVTGLVITGVEDRICSPRLQTDLARLIGFHQFDVSSGHAVQYGREKRKVCHAVGEFIRALEKMQATERLASAKAGLRVVI